MGSVSESKTPLVSVVMPAYNSSKFIEDSIQSVLYQTYTNIELLIIDDGSIDDTSLIAKKFAANYKARIVYLRQNNSGPASARNKGILLASGDWISFLDSDDFWVKDHVRSLIEKANQDEEVYLVYGSKIFVDNNGIKLPAELQPNYEMPEGWIFSKMFKNNLMCTSSLLVKREKLLEVGLFDESKALKIVEDYDLCLKITAMSKVASLPNLKYYYRRHDSNLTLDNNQRARALITAIDNAAKLLQKNKVDNNNDIKSINVRKRLIDLYEHAVLATYYSGNYPAMRKFMMEGIGRGIMTVKILEKAVLSILPKSLIQKLKPIIKGKLL